MSLMIKSLNWLPFHFKLSRHKRETQMTVNLNTITKLGEMIEEVEGIDSDEIIEGLWEIYENAYSLIDTITECNRPLT